jgi:hypothetical protein
VLGSWLHNLTLLDGLRAGDADEESELSPFAQLCALPPPSHEIWRGNDLAANARHALQGAVAQLRLRRAPPAAASASSVSPAELARVEREARERERALQAEIDTVMLAGVEALEAVNESSAETERLAKALAAERAARASDRGSASERMSELEAQLSAAQAAAASAEQPHAAAGLAAELQRLQAAMARSQSRAKAAEEAAGVARAAAAGAEQRCAGAEQECRRAQEKAARLSADHRAAMADLEKRLVASQQRCARAEAGGAAPHPPPAVAAAREGDAMHEALPILQEALDEALSQLAAQQAATRGAQRQLEAAAAALSAAAAREESLSRRFESEQEEARATLAQLRAQFEALVRGEGLAETSYRQLEPLARLEEGSEGGETESLADSSASKTPFDRSVRAAVRAQNRARFERIRAERDALKATLGEADVLRRRAQERAEALEARVSQLAGRGPPVEGRR